MAWRQAATRCGSTGVVLPFAKQRLKIGAYINQFPEQDDGSVPINGQKKYRTGFLKASWITPETRNVKFAIRRENFLSSRNNLYHYTSIGGFKGIVDSGGFWASDNRFLNDSEEMQHGAELTAEIIDYKIRRSKRSEFRSILERTREEILAPRNYGNLVACFSTARDSLEQWRGYGAAGGVCIKLGERAEGMRHVFFGPHHMLHKVFYQKRDKQVLILSIIRRYEEQYELDLISMENELPYNHDKNYFEHIVMSLSSKIVGFKNPAFKQEFESRLVIPYSFVKDYDGGLKFRVTQFGLIPYVCTGDIKGDEGLLPLEEVMIGPSPHQTLIAESVSTFLRHKGYSNTIVSLSRVPYRA